MTDVVDEFVVAKEEAREGERRGPPGVEKALLRAARGPRDCSGEGVRILRKRLPRREEEGRVVEAVGVDGSAIMLQVG